MPFYESGSVRAYQFESFNDPAVVHAVFTRHGGVSPKPWESLNMGALVGDDRIRVEHNRQLAFQAAGRDPASIYDVWQVHSAKIVCVDSPRTQGTPNIQADAILTSNPAVTLFMRFADCVPILLFDPVIGVIGLVHSGWRGTVKKIVQVAVQGMTQNYGSEVQNIRAGIGPSIGVSRYEVGREVIEAVKAAFVETWDRILINQNGSISLDLWAANRILMTQVGLRQIETASLCTASNLQDWFSHRGENGKTGRFGVLMGLKQ